MAFFTRLKTSLCRAHYKYVSTRKYRIGKCRGAEFVLWPGNYVDRRIWVEGIYEPEQIKAMLGFAANLSPDLFLDIGANIGLYSCIIGKNTQIPYIHAFECDSRNVTMYRAHVAMNAIESRVTLHEVAVGETDGAINLYMASVTSTGKSSVVAAPTKDHSITSVPLRAIDNILKEEGKTILIKMDIEGYELPAIKGMINLLTKNKCVLQVKILPDSDGDATRNYLYDHKFVLSHTIDHDHYFRNF